jgi:hypothetical protein
MRRNMRTPGLRGVSMGPLQRRLDKRAHDVELVLAPLKALAEHLVALPAAAPSVPGHLRRGSLLTRRTGVARFRQALALPLQPQTCDAPASCCSSALPSLEIVGAVALTPDHSRRRARADPFTGCDQVIGLVLPVGDSAESSAPTAAPAPKRRYATRDH